MASKTTTDKPAGKKQEEVLDETAVILNGENIFFKATSTKRLATQASQICLRRILTTLLTHSMFRV